MQTLDENKKNFMSDPTNKQAANKTADNNEMDYLASLEPIKGVVSAGAIRCQARFQKESLDSSCKVCTQHLAQEQDKYKLNYEGSPRTVCFVCYLTALKANPTDSKHRDHINGLRSDTLQNLGLQSCSKHPSSHSLSSFTYCTSCDLVQCSLCLLASPHRFHQIYPLPAALNTAKKLRDFIVTQIQDQEQALADNSADKKDDALGDHEPGGLTDTFDKFWAPLAKALNEKEAQIRAELHQMEKNFIEQKASAETRKEELVTEFKRMKKEFKHLSGLGLLQSTLSLPESGLEKAYQSNRDSFLGKTPSTGYLTPRTGGTEAFFSEPQEADTEVVYQRLLKDWRVSSLLGIRSSRLLEDIDAANQKLSEGKATKQKLFCRLSLSGVEEAVKAIEGLTLNSKHAASKTAAQPPAHRSRPSLPARPESTNLGPITSPAEMFESVQDEKKSAPNTSHFLLDVLGLQQTALGRSSIGIRPSHRPSEVPQSSYLSGPKMLGVESPIFLDLKNAPFSRKTGPSFTKLDSQGREDLTYSNLPQPFFHSHHQQVEVLPKPLKAPYNFGRPPVQILASPLPQSLQSRPGTAAPTQPTSEQPVLQPSTQLNRTIKEQAVQKVDLSKDAAKLQPKSGGRPQQSSSPSRPNKAWQAGASPQAACSKPGDKPTGCANKENKPVEKETKKDRVRETKPVKPAGGK